MARQGVTLNKLHCQKLWEWTKGDVKQLFEGFNLERLEGPSNGYTMFLFCLMDIWGSVMRDNFGDETNGHSNQNVRLFLGSLANHKPGEYEITDSNGQITQGIVKELRHNLVHTYGLGVIKTNSKKDHPNVDISGKQKTINLQITNNRWHVDCRRLKNDILEVIEEWMQNKGYL